MNPGPTISGAGHGVLLLGLIVGGWFDSPPLDPLETADVSVISAEDFAALTQNDTAPTPVVDVPDEPVVPAIEDSEAAPPAVEDPPVTPDPPVAEVPDAPDPTPLVPETPVIPDPVIAEEPPVITPPDTAVLDVPVIGAPTESPSPIAAPRVGPVPTPETLPDVDVAPDQTPPVVENAEEPAEVAVPVEPETAPEETTTEIVTEADTPGSAAPATSLFPVARPGSETEVAKPVVEPITPAIVTPGTSTTSVSGDAINDALADALATPEADPTPPIPTGPPLTRGERDGLRLAVQECWNTGSMSSEAMNVLVTIAFSMSRDGTPETGTIRMLRYEGGSEGAARQAYDTARRAISRCGARGFDLPIEKYEQWREIEMTFNPEKMRFR